MTAIETVACRKFSGIQRAHQAGQQPIVATDGSSGSNAAFTAGPTDVGSTLTYA
jgi:hypothetical protein